MEPTTEIPVAPSYSVFRRIFNDPSLERLYQSYSVKQKRAGLQCFLFAAILFDFYMLVVPHGQDLITYSVTTLFLTIAILLLVWCNVGKNKYPMVWAAIPHVAWHLANAQLLAHLFLKKNDVTGRDSLGWALLLDYLVYVTLPLRLRYCVMLSLGTCASYIAAVVGLGKHDAHLTQQRVANCLLLVAANIMGLLSYYMEDSQQRRAFLETSESLQVKLVIEEQSAEQERLLLSVLPEHVAVRMRQDLGSTDSQFKKIYMSRHENVSILYADIVGFTAISSTYSAQDLVKILNELFARFDRLAEKYQQLRIKILGDCYYCISGAPRERPDHAVLCVHMGLSMVKAIKYVQQTTNSPVDMRVGIHTGAVLAGVLGQRQWQFDVYSKDVELANKMESSGMAGRVHISEKTLSFLDGEFEVEPGYGEKREEMLRMAGIKTFFIVSVLKPYTPPKLDVRNGGALTDCEETILADGASDTKEDESKCASPAEEEAALGAERTREDSEDFKKRLRNELVSRDGHMELQKHTTPTLSFRDAAIERCYNRHRESLATLPVLGCPLVLAFTGVAQFIVLPVDFTLNVISFTVGLGILVSLSVLSIAEALSRVFPMCLVNFSRCLNDATCLRRCIAILVVVILGASNVTDMLVCKPQFSPSNCTQSEDLNTVCLYPSYFSYFCVLVLVAAVVLAQLSHLVKAGLMALLTAAHCAMNLLVIAPTLDCEEAGNHRDWANLAPGKYTLSYLLIAVTLALAYLARHMEQVSRVLFLWKTEVEEQREKASDMRSKNEALVYNVLPPHVAAHFMGNRKRSHDELYSQSYAEVGVLFASMPNFSDFYSEETVNNQGLECLRFLNEVISDFDALLELPQFQDIIKIKTIGSTYMAASGLNPSRYVKAEDPINIRWAHLALLVEFALELKKALQGINEQSFNHFVLKMGVNHGPITAGVIGARKPHYDIWGNTVNVASRMESTGKAGAIQVTEETCNILQHFNYTFEQRGFVAVKGKGQLMTYYLQGRIGKSTAQAMAAPVSPMLGLSTMETLPEEDETRDSPTKPEHVHIHNLEINGKHSPRLTKLNVYESDHLRSQNLNLTVNNGNFVYNKVEKLTETEYVFETEDNKAVHNKPLLQDGGLDTQNGAENEALLNDQS